MSSSVLSLEKLPSVSDRKTDQFKYVICGINDDISLSFRDNRAIHFSVSGEYCRTELRYISESVPVIVGDKIKDVSQLNLVAAIHKDSPNRKIILVTEGRSGSFLSNASSAGASKIISSNQAFAELRQCCALETLANKHVKISEEKEIQSANDIFEDKLSTTKISNNFSLDDTAQKRSSQYLDALQTNRAKTEKSHLEKTATTISIISGKGGCGKTTLAISTALVVNSSGFKCVLIDLDTQFGDLRFCCSNDPIFSLINISVEKDVINAAQKAFDSKQIPIIYSELKPELIQNSSSLLFEAYKRLLPVCDLVIFDTSSAWTEIHADAMEASDGILLLMDQRASSIAGCKRSEGLRTRLGIPDSKVTYALNGCSPKSQITSFDCAFALNANSVHEISDGGEQIQQAFSLGRPSVLIQAKNPLLVSSRDLIKHMIPKFSDRLDGSREYLAAKSGLARLIGEKKSRRR